MARENPLSRFGTVSLDGTKPVLSEAEGIHANASRHSALSDGHAEALEAQLKAEVQERLALAKAADGANLPDGMSLPEALKRREDRLAAIAAAKVKMEARAAERFAREQADHEAKLAARAAKAAARGRQQCQHRTADRDQTRGTPPPLVGALRESAASPIRHDPGRADGPSPQDPQRAGRPTPCANRPSSQFSASSNR